MLKNEVKSKTYRLKSEKVEVVKWTGDIKEIQSIDWIKEFRDKKEIMLVVNKEKTSLFYCNNWNGDGGKVNEGDYIVKRYAGKEAYIYTMNNERLENGFELVEEKSTNEISIKVDLDTEEAINKINDMKESVDDIKGRADNTSIIEADYMLLKEKISYSKGDRDEIEKELTEKIGTKVVIIPYGLELA